LPTHDGSPSSDLVAGFRIERRLGETIWEAVQPELGRRVALRRLEPGTPFNAAAWPDRPGVVGLFAVVEAPEGTYVATRFLPGARTLAEQRRPRRRWLDAAATTLAGIVHGNLSAHDILVDADGRVWVTGFGQAPAAASEAGDAAVLERLRPVERRGRWFVPAAVTAAAGIAAAVVLAGGGEPRIPAVPQGATAIGSALKGGDIATVDCDGRPPSGSSRSCTILQTDLRGHPLVAGEHSLVRGWAVRGASGRLTLQVVRPSRDGYVAYNNTRTVTVTDPDRPAYFSARRSVPRGARFAIEVDPGGAVGIRRRVSGARVARFFGPVRTPARQPTSARADEELMLRVDIVPWSR
jgi:hypothetical protein